MTIKKLQLIILGGLISTNALAASSNKDYYAESGVPFIATLSFGPGWSRPGESQTLTLQPQVQKSYVPHKTSNAIRFVSTAKGTDTIATGELFLGLYGPVNSVIEGQIGLDFGMSTQARLGGTIYEDANPAFNNYSYSYQVRNSRFGLKLKALYDTGFYDVLAYLSGSAAAARNHASSFAITPLLGSEVPAPLFSDHTTTSFSYTIGLGIEALVDPNWRVGIGYQFANWGQSQLTRAPGQTVGNGLHVANFRVQELMVSLSYVA